MSSRLPHDLQLKNLVDAMSDSLLGATDDEIREDAKLAGVDLEAHAASLRQMLHDTAKTFQKRKFRQAAEDYEQEAAQLQQRMVELPESPAERRALLQLVAAQQATTRESDGKFRDFESLSDNDVEVCYKSGPLWEWFPRSNQTANECSPFSFAGSSAR